MEGSDAEKEFLPKKRGRKKQLYKNILSQMEFYFSAANLAKDRWLSQKLEEEDAIHLTEFLKFNKIRALTQDVNDLAKALRKSEIISVTEDMKVRRIQPVKFKENEDDYIIYVEQIPSDADHEWLSSIFSRYGKIDYISIPKFKKSGKCKGFAFIEFADVESAEKAVKDYKERGSYLPYNTEPAELISVSTYELEQTGNDEPTTICDKSEKLPVEEDLETIEEDECTNKRKISASPEDLPKSKKHKISEETSPEEKKEVAEESSGMDDTTTPSKSKDNGGGEVNSELEPCCVSNNENDEGNADESKKKKNRKKKSKKKKNKDVIDAGLQILSKKDWKRLRNKYLNLQKEKMRQLKKHLSLARKKSELNKQNGMLKKNNSKGNNTEKGVEATEEPRKLSFSPGLIVRVECEEPVVEIKDMKKGLKKNNPGLMFVDVKEGESVMHLRFGSSETALEFCKNSSWSNTEVLEGKKETDYWKKIREEREEALSKKVKKKERGKDKLLRKAEKLLGKHITFDN